MISMYYTHSELEYKSARRTGSAGLPENHPLPIEVPSTDLAASRKFYENVFG
jgi:hypothetical protein